MYNLGVIIPAKLSLTWDAILGTITLLGTIWGIYRIISSKVSKKRYYEDLKEMRNELKEVEKKLRDELECMEMKNTASHGKLSDESERYFQILRDQIKEIFTPLNNKMDILLEHELNKKK